MASLNKGSEKNVKGGGWEMGLCNKYRVPRIRLPTSLIYPSTPWRWRQRDVNPETWSNTSSEEERKIIHLTSPCITHPIKLILQIKNSLPRHQQNPSHRNAYALHLRQPEALHIQT